MWRRQNVCFWGSFRHTGVMPLTHTLLGWKFSSDYAASALVTLGFGLETTNRKEGRRLLGLTARTAATNSLKAFRFIVATLPLW